MIYGKGALFQLVNQINMRRIIVICEGPTEQEFCETILYPFFLLKGIIIQAPLIKKSMGGIVKWSILQKEIRAHLLSDPTAFVTTFIDYYGLSKRHDFPAWENSLEVQDKVARMAFLEEKMLQCFPTELHGRLIPYIQLHEFEGLLFYDISIFDDHIPARELVGKKELRDTFAAYPNPEMINDSRETSPSHRLIRIISGYNKIVYGNYLAEAIGLQNIRSKCPRFNQWMQKIEALSEN